MEYLTSNTQKDLWWLGKGQDISGARWLMAALGKPPELSYITFAMFQDAYYKRCSDKWNSTVSQTKARK